MSSKDAMTENSVLEDANEKEAVLHEPKPKPSKIIRVLTVLAYILSVSLAAIILSIYYIFMWEGQPQVGPLRSNLEVHEGYQRIFQNPSDGRQVEIKEKYTLSPADRVGNSSQTAVGSDTIKSTTQVELIKSSMPPPAVYISKEIVDRTNTLNISEDDSSGDNVTEIMQMRMPDGYENDVEVLSSSSATTEELSWQDVQRSVEFEDELNNLTKRSLLIKKIIENV